jgi:hypothetical protein
VREAILEQVGVPLGLDVVSAAHGIFRIVNANMANAIRRVSSEAGHDPRDFAMVVYGGNGPIHAPLQAEELGIRSCSCRRRRRRSRRSASDRRLRGRPAALLHLAVHARLGGAINEITASSRRRPSASSPRPGSRTAISSSGAS